MTGGPRGTSIHVTIGRLTENGLRAKVGAHLHQIPHARILTVLCDSATRDAKRLAANHNWKTHNQEPLVIVIREGGT